MKTKTAQHTPGPWIQGKIFTKQVRAMIDPTGQTSFINIDPKHGGNGVSAICQVVGPDREANARLIAAAPELLEAAKRALGYLNTSTTASAGERELVEQIKAAIDKATEAKS